MDEVIMGNRNRERRKAKEKARAARSQEAQARSQRQTETTGWPRDGAARPFASDRGRRDALRQAVDQLIVTGVNARITQDRSELDGCVRALVETPGGAVGRRIVNRALADWSDRLVESAWTRGWQPNDLHRTVRRQGSPRQVRLAVDAVAAQMRRYAAPTVDEQWASQLRALDAVVWWTDDDARLDTWSEREGRTRAETLLDALELLAVLQTLPPIESLCPPPGTARGQARGTSPGRPSPSAGAGAGADPRVLDRVRALLAKAESTEFAEEAEALTAKAQQLMARHSIDEALLAARTGSRDRPTGRRIGIDSPYEAPKASLLDVVATANRARAVWAKSLGFATVVGFRADLDAVELLYTSLLVQATTAMTQAGSRQDRNGRSRTRSFRHSFLAAFAIRIGQRLTEATEQAGAQAAAEAGDDRLLPVLAARSDAVQDATATMFPQVISHAVSATDGEGWVRGQAAADLASLHAHGEVTAP